MTDPETIQALVKEVLDDTGLKLKVDRYQVEEELESRQVRVRCEVHDARTGAPQVIEGRGVGMVDAFFHGMVERYSHEFQSLKSLRFADFSIKAEVATAKAAARSDMTARVALHLLNSDNREFTFTHTSPSVSGSTMAVVIKAVEFFVNSEKAFVAVFRALAHAREQNRADSVARYTAQLATLVEATSYSEVIENIRKQELHR